MNSRFVNVNAQRLRDFRIARGWSQQELARRAGYTDRLVRKAESGGSLDIETVHNLAEALSQEATEVKVHYLINDNLAMTKMFMEHYDSLGREMAPHVEHILADDFVMHVAGDKSSAPFAGDWHGKAGFQGFLDCFFGTFTRKSNSLDISFLVGDESVCARYLEANVFLHGAPIPALWVNLHFSFADGFIIRIDDEYDTGATQRFDLQF